MARPAVYSARELVRPRLRSGMSMRSYAETTQCSIGIGWRRQGQDCRIKYTPAYPTRMCYRSFSQSIPLRLTSPQMETDILSSPLSPTLADSTGGAKEMLESSQLNGIDDGIPDDHKHIPKQSSHTTRIFFQSVAPHVETRTMIHLTKQLSRIVSRGHHKFDTQDRAGKKATLKRRLDAMFEPIGKGALYKPPVGTWSLKGHPWLKPIIYSFFMGKLLDKPRKEVAVPLDIGDPTYPPNQNTIEHEKHLDTLMKAQEASLSHPIFWSDKAMRESGYAFNRRGGKTLKDAREDKKQKHEQKLAKLHSRKSESKLQKEAETMMDMLVARLPPPHFNKLMGALEAFKNLESSSSPKENAKEATNDSSDSWYIDSDSGSKSLPELPESSSRASHTDWKKHRIPVLAKFLDSTSPSHAHLVVVELGRYFYVELPGVSRKEAEEGDDVESDHTTKSDENRRIAAKAIKNQRKLHTMEKKYYKSREDFVEKLMELQHEFASWEKESDDVIEEITEKVVYRETVLGDSRSQSEDLDEGGGEADVDVTADLVAGGIRIGSLKKEQEEELAETLVELQRMGLRTGDEKRSRGRPKKGHHLKFTAIRMEQKDDLSALEPESSLDSASNREAELKERIVFINNLPIDITEAEIDQIYSRCGSLDSIQLFNKRPDLDPGPMSKKQLEDRRRQDKLRYKKNSYLSLKEFRNQRPRTPVYGMLRYKTTEGYQAATIPELCIFGCVIRRHPVLSIKSEEVTKLYLEQLPTDMYAMDVEYKLAKLMQPHNIHIMLDGMKGVGANRSGMDMNDHQDYSNPSSCQVAFEDFHAASQAHQLVRQGGDGKNEDEEEKENIIAYLGDKECQVQWFRTPENAMGYWTRELGF